MKYVSWLTIILLLFLFYLTRQVSYEQILIYNDGLLWNSELTALFRDKTADFDLVSSGIRSSNLSVPGPTL